MDEEDELAKANKKTEERMRRLIELSKEPGAVAPNSLSSMNLSLATKPKKSISGKAGAQRKHSTKGLWKSIKTHTHPTGDWSKVIEEARKAKKGKKEMRRNYINDITDMEYVPDPLTKRPAEYYLPQPNIPYELKFK